MILFANILGPLGMLPRGGGPAAPAKPIAGPTQAKGSIVFLPVFALGVRINYYSGCLTPLINHEIPHFVYGLGTNVVASQDDIRGSTLLDQISTFLITLICDFNPFRI